MIVICVAAALLLGAAAWFFFAVDPVHAPIYPHCMLHDWTGLQCPGCGTARAIHAFAHGRILEGIRYNPILLPLLVWAAVLIVRPAFARKRWVGWTTLAVLLAYTVLRNIL